MLSLFMMKIKILIAFVSIVRFFSIRMVTRQKTFDEYIPTCTHK